ncbi:MAG: hypothetical protein VX447_01425 [Pseudomonadota bacterium]|nr:hypothetical protein [Pseudomonadota bacterium]
MYHGPVGPQIDKLKDGSYKYLPGGGYQYELMYEDYWNAVPNKGNNFTDDAYLSVKNISSLKGEK